MSDRPNMSSEVSRFEDIAADFTARVERIGFAIVATVDAGLRPRTRIMQPVWEADRARPVGWLITGRSSYKARHIQTNPFISIAYWDDKHEMVFVEAKALIVDDPATKREVWDLFLAGNGDYGYDPHRFFPAGSTDPNYCCIQLEPSRIELASLADRAARRPVRIWRPDPS